LKGGRGIAETEEHDDRFIETGLSNKGCFPMIVRMDKDIVISPSDINLGKVLGRMKFVEKWGNQWKGICILDGFSVERAIILTGVKFSIFLSNEEESASLRRFRGNNGSSCKMFFDKVFHCLLFRRCELISFDSFGFEIWCSFNPMIKLPMRRGNCLRSFFREDVGKKITEIQGNNLFWSLSSGFETSF